MQHLETPPLSKFTPVEAAETLRLDPAANQAARKYTPQEQLRRVLWSFGRYLMVLSPRPLFAWRRWVLRLFGAKVGRHVRVYSSAHVHALECGDRRLVFRWRERLRVQPRQGDHRAICTLS